MLPAVVLLSLCLSASSFKLISQTFNGTLTMKYSKPGMPSPNVSTINFGLDMEAVRFRQNEYSVADMPQYKMKSITKGSSIFDAAARRYTVLMDMTMTGAVNQTTKTCQYYEFPKLAEPAVVGKCVQDLAALFSPVSSEDGLEKFVIHMPMPGGNATADEAIYTDKSFVMKKCIADVNITSGPAKMTSHTEMIDMNSKAGAPDSSFFTIPSDWGTCVKAKGPIIPMPETKNAALKAFFHCMKLEEHRDMSIIV
eukprot:gnl/TRDRNA2_/TRDRNA2_194190_c0_seq1.p1 gnl/TRDRNA2_/TRDRNA2_194190_c0~~gnl/TRDRNA2_/TRDRNA2_194190_c0_seq1.p1  ORF type:complete len:279 (-),score=54.09 gnl/TRDRNA2_/TRDRNA2_194190_c0_seq1:435-1193(-)